MPQFFFYTKKIPSRTGGETKAQKLGMRVWEKGDRLTRKKNLIHKSLTRKRNSAFVHILSWQTERQKKEYWFSLLLPPSYRFGVRKEEIRLNISSHIQEVGPKVKKSFFPQVSSYAKKNKFLFRLFFSPNSKSVQPLASTSRKMATKKRAYFGLSPHLSI